MGLLDEFGAWLDNKRRVIASNAKDYARSPGLLADSLGQDFREWDAVNKSADGKWRSVMPEVRAEGWKEGVDNWKGVAGLLGAIRAWHGSPHTFDKFDMSKIGTGEGAQAYGHGLYAAESPEVANQYRVNLSYDPEKMRVGGKQINDYYRSIEDRAARMPPEKASGEYEKLDLLERLMSNDTYEQVADYAKGMSKQTQSWLRSEVRPTFETYGSTYELNLRWPDAAREAADPLGPKHFLDWDKPYAKQNPVVKSAVNERLQELGYGKGAPGLRAYHIENGGFADSIGTTMQNMFGKDPAASSAYLRDRGIPGIRYLDGGSRGAGQGTHNYVLFDDKLIDILSRNGIPVK